MLMHLHNGVPHHTLTPEPTDADLLRTSLMQCREAIRDLLSEEDSADLARESAFVLSDWFDGDPMGVRADLPGGLIRIFPPLDGREFFPAPAAWDLAGSLIKRVSLGDEPFEKATNDVEDACRLVEALAALRHLRDRGYVPLWTEWKP